MCKADSVELGQVVLFLKKWLITAIKSYFKYMPCMRLAEIKRTLSESTSIQFARAQKKIELRYEVIEKKIELT